ncbi:MAG TPA: ABC transporter permease [Dehalococcoidia bacterium]|nr:ABC transporter permease [Dehalococcoidia bacterium]
MTTETGSPRTGMLGSIRSWTGESRQALAEVLRWLVSVALPPVLLAAAAVALWELWVRWTGTAEWLVPAPTSVGERLIEDPRFFAREGLVTLTEALLGLGVGSAAALALAIVMTHSRFLERGLYPLAIGLKVTPVVVWAPLFALWFGFGTTPKVFVAALITFFPMLVNTVVGLRDVDPDAHAFLRSTGASRVEVLWFLRLPYALPYVFAGLRISALLAVIGAVVAEWSGADDGIGHAIAVANNNLDTPTVFAGIITLAVIGAILNAILALAERLVIDWHATQRA